MTGPARSLPSTPMRAAWMRLRELASAFPQRPFTVEFWDGTRIDSTAGPGPTFKVRSPKAVAHALRAPGQLGIGRAYVSGELEVDDIDLVMELLEDWKPPPLPASARLREARKSVV